MCSMPCYRVSVAVVRVWELMRLLYVSSLRGERAKHGVAAAYAGRSRAERESEQGRSARYALRSLRERKSKSSKY